VEKNIPIEATTKLVELLKPLPSAERKRAIQAAMILLGEDQSRDVVAFESPEKRAEETGNVGALPLRARTWMKQNDISATQLEQVFHLGKEGIEIIAAIPGRNKKEQTYNAYILVGLSQLLLTGNAVFQDKPARALCESSGCYDVANHGAHLKNRGNEFTGTKDKGWTLTVPGLRRAAEIVKEINGQTRV
jgi:hypothetical protein